MQRKVFLEYVGWLYVVTIAGCNPDKVSFKTTHARNTKELKPFNGKWTNRQAAHLLRRSTLGFNAEESDKATTLGLTETINTLLAKPVKPAPPVNFEFKEDTYAPIGKTWVNSPYLEFVYFEQYRKKSLRTWALSNIHNERFSIAENMVLFWLNYFGVSDVIEHRYEYNHIELLRKFAFGNFKQLMKEITIDPAMLRFLSGYENTSQSPNENYAREFLELFTVGKGPLAAEGDYTTFTEADVAAIARIMSGWTDEGWFTFDENLEPHSIYRDFFHTQGVKKLSHRLGGYDVLPLKQKEFEKLIDIVFKQRAVALNFCRRLYRWFVYSEITPETEKNIIEPLADIFEENNFEVYPVIKTLLTSNHFFEAPEQKPRLKNPLEYIFSVLKFFPVNVSDDIYHKYNFWQHIYLSASSMGMEYLKPPSVAGWKAYYQAPGYYKFWINAATLQNRKFFGNQIVDEGYDTTGYVTSIDTRAYLLSIENCTPEKIVEQCNAHLFCQPLSSQQQSILLQILYNGMNTVEWTNELNQLKQNNNTGNIIQQNTKQFLKTLFSLPQLNIA